MAEIIKLTKARRSLKRATKGKSKPGTKPITGIGKGQKSGKSLPFKLAILATPLAMELMEDREILPPLPRDQSTILEAGVLAYRRGSKGRTSILLITKKRSRKWGIPKGKVVSHLSFPENAAKEAFEEAGVIGYISPSSVGVFRTRKRNANLQGHHVIEVWVYLLEVSETLADWPERQQRTTRWVSCETAARLLREQVLAHLCHRLAQS
jgi:8-oxo-dGTP pyrophosphatase MutT (NUDIX family)